MKKKIQKYIRSLGGWSYYSGNTKTMYIDDPLLGTGKQTIEECIYIHFGFELPFTLKNN